MFEILARGRWSCVRSVRKDCKSDKVQQLVSRLAEAGKKYTEWCRLNMLDVSNGRVAAPLPPSLGGVLPPTKKKGRAASTKRPAAAAPDAGAEYAALSSSANGSHEARQHLSRKKLKRK